MFEADGRVIHIELQDIVGTPPAMHLLQSGVDITVIALWLDHEDPTTTHLYVEADLAMKEATLKRVNDLAPGTPISRLPTESYG